MRIRMAGPAWRGKVAYVHERVPDDIFRAYKGATVTVYVAGEARAATLGTHVKVSLQTRDEGVAKERYLDVAGQLNEAYAKMRQAVAAGPVRLTDRQCRELAGVYFKRIKAEHSDDPGDPEEWDASNSAARDIGQTPKGRESLHGVWADDLLRANGLAALPESRQRLIDAMHGAYLKAVWRVEQWANGKWAPMEGGEEEFPKPVEVKEKPNLTLADVRDTYVKDREAVGKKPKSISMFRHYFGTLVEFLGEGDRKDANSVTPDDIEGWLQWLAGERAGKRGKPVSRKTIADGYLTLVQAGFRKSRRKLTQWPFEDVEFDPGDIVRERSKGFSDAEARAILIAARDGLGVGEGTGEHVRRAIRWVPWICAYTGARVGEITQLRKQDFMTERGIKFFRITPEAGTVKSGEYRDVPIHPHLLEQGLWEMVQDLPGERLFWSPGMAKGSSTKNRLGEWVRQGVGITDKRLQPNHAWRHRFITLARRRIDSQVWMAITGHSDGPKKAADDYGEVDLETRCEAIALIPRVEVE